MSNNNTPNTETATTYDVVGTSSNIDGVQIGDASTDKVAFYGKIPYSQKATTAQAVGSATSSSSGSFWGASMVNATSWTMQKCASSALTAASSASGGHVAGAAAAVIAEIVDTLVGLGVWKGNS